MNLNKLFFLIILLLSNTTLFAAELDVQAFEHLAIQDGGRIKPFDTFARESVQLITGKQNYMSKNPTELVLSWLFFPQEWSENKFFQIKHLELKKDLNLKKEDGYLSPAQVKMNEKLGEIFNNLDNLNKEKKKLNPYYQAAQRLRNQIFLYNEIISGHAFKLVPQKLSHDWLFLPELKDDFKLSFQNVVHNYFSAIAKNEPQIFTQAVGEFKLKAKSSGDYPSDNILKIEVTYNKLRPFRMAYLFYFLSGLIFLLSFRKQIKVKYINYIAYGSLSIGLIYHLYGFVVRSWLTGRAPVSNMYESVIWVGLGCLIFGGILEYIYKKRFLITAATLMAALCLFVGDSVPMVLDQSIRPLEPVLRSNFWLTTHVLIITLSYAAFALASGIGNYGIGVASGIFSGNKEKTKQLALYVYRCLQIGVLLLTAGTILGGVWADYSWGRFWGWDPKETWALIADLAYLAILHGRFTGWLKDFGTMAASVCCFVTVIMAWYGVNFILGVGLHSYGFGSGGVQYVAAIVAVQFTYVGYTWWRYKKTDQ
ncbi:MAG: cytochrome c biogenesis protein CcsA [Oligoflexia bacterium]|nr:cytochrome c biogenesis protein CcsA [Oligoflexia bacterium]